MKTLLVFFSICLFIISACDTDSAVQVQTTTTLTAADSVVSLFASLPNSLVEYSLNPNPYIRIDSNVVYSTYPPGVITSGTLFLYVRGNLIDSIPYYSYHNSICRPGVNALSVSGTYVLRIITAVGGMYNEDPSNWYLMRNDGTELFKCPKVQNISENGLYEIADINIGNVRSSSNILIFYGKQYCNKETYVTWNIPNGFVNYHRQRTGDCESPWVWKP